MLQRSRLPVVTIFLVTVALLTTASSRPSEGQQWKPNEVIKPEQLVKMLSRKSTDRPLVLQVGFDFLYQGGHIDGASWAGPASRPDGIARLKDAVKNVPRDREIVIYCGCCPWSECPNILPAFEILKELGFKNVRALYIPIDLERDWISKGYPTQTGRDNGAK